jgi:hypothetical protein
MVIVLRWRRKRGVMGLRPPPANHTSTSHIEKRLQDKTKTYLLNYSNYLHTHTHTHTFPICKQHDINHTHTSKQWNKPQPKSKQLEIMK